MIQYHNSAFVKISSLGFRPFLFRKCPREFLFKGEVGAPSAAVVVGNNARLFPLSPTRVFQERCFVCYRSEHCRRHVSTLSGLLPRRVPCRQLIPFLAGILRRRGMMVMDLVYRHMIEQALSHIGSGRILQRLFQALWNFQLSAYCSLGKIPMRGNNRISVSFHPPHPEFFPRKMFLSCNKIN